MTETFWLLLELQKNLIQPGKLCKTFEITCQSPGAGSGPRGILSALQIIYVISIFVPMLSLVNVMIPADETLFSFRI